jgi:hypothetical protein
VPQPISSQQANEVWFNAYAMAYVIATHDEREARVEWACRLADEALKALEDYIQAGGRSAANGGTR